MAVAFAGTAACNTGSPGGGGDDDDDDTGPDPFEEELAQREIDYNAALRIAALRLTGDLPTLAEINEIANAGDLAAQKVAYEARITEYLNRPTFARQAFNFWSDTFRMGGSPEMDTAPALAAKLTVENGNYMNLFTQTSGNCPTYDGASTFTSAECPGTGPQAGILGNPNFHQQYYSNMAFRRVKAIQELFDCAKFPAPSDSTEGVAIQGAAALYTGKRPFTDVATTPTGEINFQDASSVVCANCHSTLNPAAPLFAFYDDQGVYTGQFAVPVPNPDNDTVRMVDYLAPGVSTAWRFGVDVPSDPMVGIPAFGAAMSNDPYVAKCGVTRIWNWMMGRQDVVDGLAAVPDDTVQEVVDAFRASGYTIKDMIKNVLFNDHFVKF
jgi:hypothetical protein